MFHLRHVRFVRRSFPLCSAALSILTLCTFGSSVVYAQSWIEESLVLEPVLSNRLNHTVTASTETGAWNCINVGLAEAMPAARMIVPNDESGDPDRVRHMLRLGKDLFVSCVTQSGGLIQTDYDAGVLVGIEFRLWTANPVPQPAVTDTLGYRGAMYRSAGDTFEFLGWVYCYTGPQFTARLAAIADFMGGTPLAQERVWLGALAEASDTGPVSLRIQGTRNDVFGDLCSQGTTRLLGANNAVADVIRWAVQFVAGGTGNTFGAAEHEAAPLEARLPRNNEAFYKSLATAAGQSFLGDIMIEDDGAGGAKVGDQSVSGVIYTTGVIYVEGDDGIDAPLTLVAQAGVNFYGNGCTIHAAVDDLLAWVPGIPETSAPEHNNVSFEGRFNELIGAVYSGLGDVEIETLGSTLYGRYTGSRIKVGGAENLISDGTN